LDGKRRQKRAFSKDRNKAIAKLNKLRAEVAAGHIAVTGKTTVEAWLQRWIEDIRGPKLRPGTKDDYARTIRLHINPHIGTKRLDRLSAQDVRVMQTSIKQSRTAQLAHVILRSALGDAIKEGMLTRNVAEVAEKPKHVTSQRSPLSSPEAKQLLRSAIDSGDRWATRWAAALLLGARQGEILGLQWNRLDLDNGIADFRWQLQQLEQAHGCGQRHSDKTTPSVVVATDGVDEMNPPRENSTWPCGRKRPGWCPQRRWDLPRGFEHQILHRSLALTAPKTRAGTRIVPIPAPLWALLQIHPHGTDNPHGLVWHHDDGRPISPRDDYDNWQTALSNAGLPPAPLHIARNTCASLLAEAGVPEDIRMAILGQVSLTAHRSYVYRDQTQTRQAMTALDQLLG
jgi:integrase